MAEDQQYLKSHEDDKEKKVTDKDTKKDKQTYDVEDFKTLSDGKNKMKDEGMKERGA